MIVTNDQKLAVYSLANLSLTGLNQVIAALQPILSILLIAAQLTAAVWTVHHLWKNRKK